MTKLEPIAESPRGLYEAVFAPVTAELILAAIKADLFRHLEKPASPEALAGQLGWEPRAAGVLLNGLASCDLLGKRDGLFSNSPETSRFLVPGKPTFLGNHLLATHHMVTGGLAGLAERLQGGPAPETADAGPAGETDWSAMAEGMANSARAGRALFAQGLVRKLPEFAWFKKMLDLGGGPGIHCIAMVQAHPSMTGVVFDRPAMGDKARQYIDEYGLSERIAFMGGDYMSDSIGSGYDLIWACASLNFCGDDLGGLMAKLRQALNPGGVLAVLQEGLTHEGTKPAEMVLPMLAWRLVSDEGVNFEQGQIASAMLEAGFRSVRSQTLDTVHGVMDLDVARK
ncbi:MAG: methyltransferase domain-containing protein [Desulfarculaceae bacterium]|nr:methyltransferase domain-containing protein [Desulfarculaceae bacterium]MCF8072557.1 methyltransferase domain-containing protein [Desulfarculaceae bacterium]MCF8103460.1 methyltransferase domain-containing protein [Desulfarculaceae bacterium]MCF8117522.1 methyltransferase domain-containing protein [Desulfarculaceae bacterium]